MSNSGGGGGGNESRCGKQKRVETMNKGKTDTKRKLSGEVKSKTIETCETDEEEEVFDSEVGYSDMEEYPMRKEFRKIDVGNSSVTRKKGTEGTKKEENMSEQEVFGRRDSNARRPPRKRNSSIAMECQQDARARRRNCV